jgi:hypothetical protein
MPDRMHPEARGQPLARRHLRQDIGGRRHVRCGGHHTAAPVVVKPPQIGAIRKTLIKDDLVQASVAGKIRPRLGDQCPGPVHCMLLHLPHLDGQWHLGHGIALRRICCNRAMISGRAMNSSGTKM